MKNKLKIKNIIGMMALMISPLSFAGVNEFCQYLHDSGSLNREPVVCSNYIPDAQKSLPEVVVTNGQSAIKAGGSASTSYIYEGRTTDNMSIHPVDDFSTQTVLGTVPGDIFAMAFDETGGTLYALENAAKELLTVDQVTGGLTVVGPLTNAIAADTMTGLDIAPDGTCYATSTDGVSSTLYTCDLSTGTLTVVGTQSTTPLLIGIATDCKGTIYGHDIGDDNIYTIDSTTGAATVVGLTGLNANFAQDITYDREDHRLYGYIYTGGGTNTYGPIDVCTGAVTPLAVDNPLGEHYGASKTDCAMSDIIFRGGFDC